MGLESTQDERWLNKVPSGPKAIEVLFGNICSTFFSLLEPHTIRDNALDAIQVEILKAIRVSCLLQDLADVHYHKRRLEFCEKRHSAEDMDELVLVQPRCSDGLIDRATHHIKNSFSEFTHGDAVNVIVIAIGPSSDEALNTQVGYHIRELRVAGVLSI